MAAEFHDLVGQSGTYNTTGPKVDLDGAAKDDHQTFVTAVTNAATVYVLIKKDATNLLVWEATFNDAATDNVTRVTELTAIGTISNTDTVDVYLVNPAAHIKRNFEHSSRFISGIIPSWTDDDTVAWSEGQAVVNGELLDYAAANSGNLGQSDAGLSATGVWNHYLYDNAGTPTIELSQTGPVDGGDRLFWHKSGDVTRRWIGWHWVYTDTTRKIGEFWASADGNLLTLEWPVELQCRIKSTVPTTTLAELTNLNQVSPDNCYEIKLNTKFSSSAGGADLNAVASAADITSRAGKANSHLSVRATFDNGGFTFFGPCWMVLDDPNSLWVAYSAPAGTMDAYLLDLQGGKVMR